MQWTGVLGRAEVAGVGHTETPTLIPGYSGVPEGHKTAGIMEANSQEHPLYVPPSVEGHQDKGQGGRRCLAGLQGHPKKNPPKPKLGVLDRTVGERCRTRLLYSILQLGLRDK